MTTGWPENYVPNDPHVVYVRQLRSEIERIADLAAADGQDDIAWELYDLLKPPVPGPRGDAAIAERSKVVSGDQDRR